MGSGIESIPSHLENIKLSDIRKKTGLSWSMISRVFSEDPEQRRSPSLRNAKKIADALGISIDLLHDVLG